MNLYRFDVYDSNNEATFKLVKSTTDGCSDEAEIERIVHWLLFEREDLQKVLTHTAWVRVWKMESVFTYNDSRWKQ